MIAKEDLINELKEKVIESLGSESTAASVFENPEFINKLEEILAWLIGKIILDYQQTMPQPYPPREDKEIIWPEIKPWHKEHSWYGSPWHTTTDIYKDMDTWHTTGGKL